ncbi:DUF6082 family protein [Actinomadura xylanilytica]|uniref:DUF6082 family protein n=1 Tax=Actinomadura xylanilytica TaxID=887459 RepID=UPI00255AFF48|nr:DUF6082 family protein [Actinomadura xylanilytica]MDL4774522.1 DUF6082 family protein [Actinomadura xylanilytica]
MAVLLLLVIVLVCGLVAVSPFALGTLSSRSGDWEELSWIGQTYGAASALLAVLALIGVAVSLFMQAHEAKAAREQGLRAVHTDLLQMAMDDPLYRGCWGPFFASGNVDGQREHMYVNLIISNWQMRYELRAISEEHLRATAHIVFSGEPGRRFWAEGRDLRLRAAGGRRERRFLHLLDEEYEHALREPARPPAPARPPRSPRRRPPWTLLAFAAAGLAAAAPFLRRLRSRHD